MCIRDSPYGFSAELSVGRKGRVRRLPRDSRVVRLEETADRCWDGASGVLDQHGDQTVHDRQRLSCGPARRGCKTQSHGRKSCLHSADRDAHRALRPRPSPAQQRRGRRRLQFWPVGKMRLRLQVTAASPSSSFSDAVCHGSLRRHFSLPESTTLLFFSLLLLLRATNVSPTFSLVSSWWI